MATNKTSITERVRAYQKMHPNATTAQVAKACKTTVKYVYGIRYSDKRGGTNVKTKDAVLEKLKTMPLTYARKAEIKRQVEADHIEAQHTDNVNHPAHYKVGGVEVIDFIEAKKLNYHLGNVVKYIARADEKGNREEDLLKARWYLNREIAKFSK